jgi:mycofactocin system glycosyltransferase
VLDASARQLRDDLWFGGSPARVLRLTPAGRLAWRELADGPISTPAAGMLARRFTDAGLAHPLPPAPEGPPDLTVVIPVYGRPDLLGTCLSALDRRHPALVVDDGSPDPAAIAKIAAGHGVTVLRRDTNGGPAAARNTALASVSTELVAFLDSDCVPSAGWAEAVAAHFADPMVGAVAPRVRPLAPQSWAGHYTRAGGSLDLGGQPARVAPSTRMSYVPTAAFVARRAALDEVAETAEHGMVFDERMRVGEDVDLVWRLHAAGWRVRYDPAVHLDHHEPTTWPGLLRRRARYGTSAGPLARRRPAAIAPLVLHPWPTLAVAGLLGRRPLLAACAFGMAVLTMRRTLRAQDIPTDGVVRAMGTAVWQTWLGIGRYGTQFSAPVLLAALAEPGRRRWGRRAAVASLLLGPPLNAWLSRRPPLDPVRYTLGSLADDIAYGSGVWAGCLTQRTAVPLLPRISWHPLRVEREPKRGTS